MILRHQLPRMIERGVTQTLDADVYTAAGAQQTPSAAALTLYQGAKVLLDGVTATAGAPTTYSLADSVTDGLSLSDQWLEVWSLTIGGTVYQLRRAAYLVRHVLYPVITDTDLTDLHSDLADLRDPDQSSYEAQRTRAWVDIQAYLIGRGRRPELVLDSWALRNWHTYQTLALIFRDFALSTGIAPDRRYRELADHYAAAAKEARESLVFRYDADEDGTPDDEGRQQVHGVVYLSQPPTWDY